MLSVVLAAVLEPAFPAERLHLDVFEDYAKGLVGEGWKLEMDRSIAGRPVVWYLGKPGDGVSDLKRSCELLDLGCFEDREKKKIFVSGPLASAGPTFRQMIQRTLEEFREDTLAMAEKSPADIRAGYNLAHRIIATEGLDEAARAKARRTIVASQYMIDREDRVCAAQLFSMGAADVAARLDNSPHGLIRMRLGQAAQHEFEMLIKEGISPLFDEARIAGAEDDTESALMRQDNENRAKEFRDRLTENPTVEVWISAGKSGEVEAKLHFISDQSDSVFGSFSLVGRRMPTVNKGDKLTFAEMMAILQPIWETPEKQLLPGSVTCNSYAETMFEKGNSVSWLQEPLTPYFRMISDDKYMEQFYLRHTEDGWLEVYSRWDRYPRFGEGWGSTLRWFDLSRDGVSGDDVRSWAMGLTPEEMEHAGWAVGSMNLHGDPVSWIENGLLVQAAYREMEVPVSRMGAQAQRCLTQYLDSVGVWESYPSLGREFHRRKRGDYVFRLWLREGEIEVELETSFEENGSPVYLRATVPVTKE